MKPACTVLALCIAVPAIAETPPLKPELAPVGFLVGRWEGADGKVADTGGSSKGSSVVTVEANGGVLLRRDHTDLFDAKHNATGGFDLIMLIYPEGNEIHADYSDGDHVIHYASAAVVPGSSVTFSSASVPGAPTFQLSYTVQGTDSLLLKFGMILPGQTAFHAIATGTLTRARSR